MNNYEKLIDTLKEIFMLDKADLDFGIYRIMNQKRQDIERFLEQELLPQVKGVLSEHGSVDKAGLQKELDTLIKQVTELGYNPDENPKVTQLRNRIEQAPDLTGLENEVFSLLASFFKRYFDNGDFISMRRYKKDVYAIPYEGEEVKLHWANADQYYIKSSEYFKRYRFKLSSEKTVSFELISASTEQNNNKAQNDKERRFALYMDQPVEVAGNELKIFFTYEPMDKKVKQESLLEQAFEAVKGNVSGAGFAEALAPAPTKAHPKRTLLQKHLQDYAARNTFDYFIHKDLGGFLTRELDFFIKNEVLFIDDINTREEQAFLADLGKVKAIKKIGEKIIAFLAQLENFQKKLWLKKKFVIETNYCITLDRIPERMYPEIAANEAQIQEWTRLFAIGELEGDMHSESFSIPITTSFLSSNPFLILDTYYFDDEFKWRLRNEIEEFDTKCNGLVIQSDNFQAINLLQERYSKEIGCIYIDPPYNTDGSEILYKNGYKSSSWVSMLDSRLGLSKRLLTEDGVLIAAIDDAQQKELNYLVNQHFNGRILGTLVVRSNPSGRPTESGYAVSHEYLLFVGKGEKSKIGRLPPTKEQMARFKEKDDDGVFEWRNLRREGSDSDRSSRRAMYYPIFIRGQEIRVPKMEWNETEESWIILEEPDNDEEVILPINDEGDEKRWRWEWGTLIDSLDRLSIRKDRTGKNYIYYKRRPHESGVVSVSSWFDAKYSATEHGTALLKALFRKSPFSYPKSLYAVMDAVYIGGGSNPNTTVLDYFGGSGTTGHAIINLNRQDYGKRKFILVEMGDYFDSVTLPRIKKVVYSKDWKDGKPISRDGISHCFKYIRLESYEDTLNNLELRQTEGQLNALQEATLHFREGYTLNYMLDVESSGSLLNLEWFKDPFNCTLNITRNNELKPTRVDLAETFNYLIGLTVHNYAVPKEGYMVVTGRNREEEKILVIWRDCNKHDNTSLNEFLQKSKYNPLDGEFDRIYVNGDNNVENLKTGDERWKVVLIEEEFGKRMFEMN